MRAAILVDGAPQLTIEDIPIPQPRAGEVLVRVHACGVCHTDLHVIKSEVGFPRPAVLGHEVSGVVVEVGPGVKNVAEGDSIVSSFIMPCGTCRRCVRGHEDLCEDFFAFNRLKGTLYDGETRLARTNGDPLWMYSMGGLAEYCVIPATAVFPIPENLDPSSSAILGCSLFTAYGAVHNVAGLRMGESVAVIATGGVGSSIVQLCATYGPREIIAVDVSEEKLSAARALGATHTINASEVDPVEAIRDLTDGRGVDVSFEALGMPQTFRTAIEVLDDGGRAVMVGIAPAGLEGQVDITRIVRRKLQILGSYGGRARTDMPVLIDMVARGVIRPADVVTRTYDLESAGEAFNALDRREIVGRAIIVN